MVQTISMKTETYPSERVPIWSVTSQEVKECIDRGDIPQIVLPSVSRRNHQPVIAVILAQDVHPDRTEKDYTIFPDYVDSVVKQGAYPVFIAYDRVDEQLAAAKPDGILLVGGNFRLIKENDKGYEPRPQTYVTMIEYAKKYNLPLFGICGGEQMLAVYFGASVKVNINDTSERYSGHMQKPYQTSHSVELADNSQIGKIIGRSTIEVNSCHKTAVMINDTNSVFAAGIALDGVTEVVELQNPWNKDFVIGVQWHPERLARTGDADSLKLFGAFVKAAQIVKERRIYT